MKSGLLLGLAICLVALCLTAPPPAHGLDAVKEHKSEGTGSVVINASELSGITIAGDKASLALIRKAAERISAAVAAGNAKNLPVATWGKQSSRPDSHQVVLATTEGLRLAIPDAEEKSPELAQVVFIDDQGFAIDVVDGSPVIAARTARGVYNGAVYFIQFYIDGSSMSVEPVVRTPQMKGRPAYVCNIWGGDQFYTADDWNTIFQTFADEGIDRLYFWVSGHFPSKKFPQTYKWKDAEWDSTVDSKIGTIDALQAVIRHAHDLGLKFYLSGGLGAWTGTGNLTNNQPGTMKTGSGFTPGSLCPSNSISRRSLIDYYTEMFDALPEADGVYIELADEWGACECKDCSKTLDEYGSRQFGQSQLSLAREIAASIWRKHPHAHFSFTVGYDEHAKDPLFYEMVRRMTDPRIEWMEARGRWEFSGPGGVDLPAAYFSNHIMRWRQWYTKPLQEMVQDANQAAKAGFYGLITSFEPGFGSGSFYKDIPFPMNLVPYCLTSFAFREMTWDPTLSMEQLKARVAKRFFSDGAPASLTDDLFSLRELIRTTGKKNQPADHDAQLEKIEQDLASAEGSAGPKTRDSIALMRRAIKDIRAQRPQEK